MKKNRDEKPLYKSLSPYIWNSEQMKPGKEAFRISLVYLLFGILWVTLSDWIFYSQINNSATYNVIQTYKGWLYGKSVV